MFLRSKNDYFIGDRKVLISGKDYLITGDTSDMVTIPFGYFVVNERGGEGVYCRADYFYSQEESRELRLGEICN